MYGENQFEMRCSEFETLLADALDGTLTGARRQAFDAHRQSCPACAPVYAEAEAGLQWLSALKAEPAEPPARLMENILKATSWAQLPEKSPRQPWWQRVPKLPGVTAFLDTVFQPRFAMSAAMAFFSISVLFTITGFKVRDLRYADLRPTAIMRGISETEGKVVKYYENIRFVYEIESRVRDLKRATTPEETAPPPEKSKEPKDNRTGAPEQQQFRNYSSDEMRPLLAAWHGAVRQVGTTAQAVALEDRRWL